MFYFSRRSCLDIHSHGVKHSKSLKDGIYFVRMINESTYQPVYCDMSRDGGGWTLLVTSHTATWTQDNVLLRNADKPSMTVDYSILKYADSIKDNVNVVGTTFEYRLEAQDRGKFNFL